MHVRSLHMTRQGDYGSDYQRFDPTKPFNTVVKLEGDGNKVELQIPAEVSEKILALVADQLVEAGRRAAEAMVAKAFTVEALPAPEPAPTPLDDEIPF